MIKAIELGTGNLIMIDDKHTSYITGTPLTREWLERCGFVNQNMLISKSNTWWKDGMGEYISYHGDGFCVFEFGKKPVIKYVHQLQNLYFALSGEELTIKEKI